MFPCVFANLGVFGIDIIPFFVEVYWPDPIRRRLGVRKSIGWCRWLIVWGSYKSPFMRWRREIHTEDQGEETRV
jgi:hypothetical protein